MNGRMTVNPADAVDCDAGIAGVMMSKVYHSGERVCCVSCAVGYCTCLTLAGSLFHG